MSDVAPPKSSQLAPEPVLHPPGDAPHGQDPHACQHAYAKLHDHIFEALVKPRRSWLSNRTRSIARRGLRILAVPARWMASLGDLLVHWWNGFLKSLRSERGYLTAGSILAVYLAVFGLFDTKST